MPKRLLIAVAFAIVSVVCGYMYIEGLGAATTGGRKVPVLVAAAEIPAGTRISKEMLGVREIPEAYVHPESITAGPAEESRLLGRPLFAKLAQGQPLLWSGFDVQKAGPQKLSAGVPRHKRALTLPIDQSGGFSGMLRSGDHIDVLGTFTQGAGQAQTVTLLQNLAVLAVGDMRAENEGPTRGFSSVTLAVDLDEAELLVFAQSRGSLGYALRGEGDFETVNDIAEKSFGDVLDVHRRQAQYNKHAAGGPAIPAAATPRAGGQ
jgi:pilus assembly protein CpaB